MNTPESRTLELTADELHAVLLGLSLARDEYQAMKERTGLAPYEREEHRIVFQLCMRVADVLEELMNRPLPVSVWEGLQ